MGKMDYLKEMPIAVLGGGAVGKTCAADMKLAGREVRLFDMMPFAEKTLAHLDKTGIVKCPPMSRHEFAYDPNSSFH